MKFTYIRDISEKSVDRIHTPAYSYLWLPLLLHNCGHAWSFRNFYIEREGLNNYFMLYTHSGSGRLRYGSNEIILTPGTIIMFHCLNYQWYGTISSEPWEYHYLHFSGSMAEKIYTVMGGKGISPITVGHDSSIVKLWENLYDNIGDNHSFVDMQNCSLLMQLLTAIFPYRNEFSTDVSHPYASELESILKIMEDQYNTKIRLEDLSQSLHISKCYFIKIFKQYKGVSPYEYLLHFRINQAKRLLLQTNMTISEIALQIGFDDSSSFIRCFKKYTGTSPLKYRNSGGEGLFLLSNDIHQEKTAD